MTGHVLPDLPFAYDALEPHVDARALKLHHRRVHQGHVDRLTAVLGQLDRGLADLPVDELLRRIDEVPEDVRSAVRNYGGGHANHSLLWTSLSPAGGGAPSGALGAAIDETFGSFEVFRDRFSLIAANLFGSGWIWLILTRGKLVLYTLPNNDSPLLVGERPLLGLDLWEHAYCTEHQWRQSDYVDTFWNIVDWEAVGHRYQSGRDAAAQRRCHQTQPA
ncbi:MAG: superoxide dismutase [Acidimicrobiia bacterium]